MSTVPAVRRDTQQSDDDKLNATLANASQSRDTMMLRLENETIMAACKAEPRDMVAVKNQLGGLLHAFPEFADDAIYSKDVGGGKFAEDLSIRAAEALAEAYGYNRIRASVSMVDDDHAKVEATFTDFQSGRVWQDDVIVSKWYTASKTKGGGRVRYDDDRFLNTVVKAAKSKVIREVICRSVNPAGTAWFKNECEKVMQLQLTPDKVASMVKAWADIGVGLEKLEALVGKPKAMGWMASDASRLRTLFVAVRDGEETVESLLNPTKPAADVSQAEIDAQLAAKNAAKKPAAEPAKTPPKKKTEAELFDEAQRGDAAE
jgi:hypothetical protein